MCNDYVKLLIEHTTSEINRYDEAMDYLKKAEESDPKNEHIQKIKEKITYEQAYWYVHLGDMNVEHGDKIYNIYTRDGSDNDNSSDARDESEEYFNKAMDYYLLAAAYLPNDANILQHIKDLENNKNGPIYRLNWYRARKQRINDSHIQQEKDRLHKLRQELLQAQKDLANLKKK